MGWWSTVVQPSLKTAVVSSCDIYPSSSPCSGCQSVCPESEEVTHGRRRFQGFYNTGQKSSKTEEVSKTVFFYNTQFRISSMTNSFPYGPRGPYRSYSLVPDPQIFWNCETSSVRGWFGSEVSVMRQCRFLHITRLGLDVVDSTLWCEGDGLPNLLIIEEAHGKTSWHYRSGPLHVHLPSCPGVLEWVRPTSHFSRGVDLLPHHNTVRIPL